MNMLSRLLKREPLTPAIREDDAPTFSIIGPESIPAEFFGLPAYETTPAMASRVDRATALQVPAVKRARDLIAGTLATLPLEMFAPDNTLSVWPLLQQPEVGIPRSVTLARTYEDLLFEGTAWWLITEYGWHTFPTRVKRLDPRTVDVKQDGRVYVTRDGHRGQTCEWVQDRDLIRFDSPNAGLLTAGARAIRTALLLDAAAQRNVEGAPPIDWFSPAEGADPAEDEDITALLDAWQTARRTRATGYVPASLIYNTGGFSPEQLQMADARQHAVLEIARVAGVDPEDLGVSTTSRTYFNAFDRKQARIQDTLRGYAVAFEERLSMNDVTPRGSVVKTNFSDMLRSDDLTRFQSYRAGLDVGVYEDRNAVRAAEGLAPTTTTAQESTDA